VDRSVNQALSFDGVDDYASVGTARMPQVTRDQSIMVWYRAAPGGADRQALFTLRRGEESGIVLALEQGLPYVYNPYGSRTLARASAAASSDEWHHLGFVVQGESCTLYVDGSVAQAADQGPSTNRTPLQGLLGTADGYHESFSGALDELRVYDRALPEEEVAAVAAGEPLDSVSESLVLFLPFDEAQGARAYDRSGLGNHAELGDGVPSLMPTRIAAER
jgi:sialidase-1